MQNLHENEIQELYTFFEQWYRGTIENSDEDFRRLEDVLAPEFTLITLSDIPLPGLETASKNLLTLQVCCLQAHLVYSTFVM